MGSEVAFYPGGTDARMTVDDSLLTGRLLAHTDDVETLRAHPDVAELTVLPGRGDVVSIVPRPGVSGVSLANALHGEAGIAWAHPDFVFPIRPDSIPDDPLLTNQWHLVNEGQRGYVPGVDVNAEEAWDIATGAGIRVAVLDSGVDTDHPDLVVIDGRDYVDDDDSSDPDNDDNHGTAAAGLVAATGNNGVGMVGVAYEAEIYGIRILSEGDSTGGATTEEIYQAFVEAVDNGAHVINNSWGPGDFRCTGYALPGAFLDAFEYVENEGRDGLGTVNVFSAGNSGCDITNDGLLEHPSIIGVAAVTGFDRRAGYSNFGPWVDIGAPSNRIATLDLAGEAGGNTNVDGDLDYTGNFGGTSASAPQVAGVAALMLEANPRLTAADVRQVLCDTAVKIDITRADYDELGFSPLYGCGRIDAGAAVRVVANLGAPDAPELATAATQVSNPVVLRWPDATDPDDDYLTYRLRWALATDPDNEKTELIDGNALDLTELLGNTTATVQWRVRAIDPWGPGPWSETQVLSLTRPEPESSGCQHTPGPGIAGLLGVLALAGRRRRR